MLVTSKAVHPSPLILSGDPLFAHSYERALQGVRFPLDCEIDAQGHVNNVVYLAWSEEIGLAHWNHISPQKDKQIFGWVGIQHDIEYKDELLLNNQAVLRTWIDEPRGAILTRHVDIRKHGAPKFAARITSKWCLISQTNKKPQRINKKIANMFGFNKS